MSFMKPEIEHGTWYEVDTTHGIFFLPYDVLGWSEDELLSEDWQSCTEDYIEGEPQEIKVVDGWGVRMSASGYTDCTEWSVFDTEQEAIDFCAEAYEYHWDELDEVDW